MSDATPRHAESTIESDEPQAESREETPAGLQPASRTRYRPSEAWAMRWLGPARA